MTSFPTHSETLDFPAQGDVCGIFRALRQPGQPAMLLESREVESGAARYTRMMVSAALRLECHGREVTARALTPFGREMLEPLRESVAGLGAGFTNRSTPGEVTFTCPPVPAGLDEDQRLKFPSQVSVLRQAGGLLGKVGCLYGGFAFDFIETFEPIEAVSPAPAGQDYPDYLFFLAQEQVVVDHVLNTATLTQWGAGGPALAARVAEVFRFSTPCAEPVAERGAAQAGAAQAGAAQAGAAQAGAAGPTGPTLVASPTVSDGEFAGLVSRLQEHINSGDIYQVVPSRGYTLACPEPLAAYRQLRAANPSPYLFFYQDEERVIFGSSPEACVKVDPHTQLVTVRPIAGTMPRALRADGSIDPEEDSRRQVRLRTDAKETAEHLMLVDLARNDVARISEGSTRQVDSLLTLELYSRVMHLVSQVSGRLRADLDALDAYRACMNMGTLTGAPKIKATNLIRAYEGRRRGIYGGAIGYYQGDGSLDTCIAIRCAQVVEGQAIVRAGAGVVRDSVPLKEAAETTHKARAVLEAIARAQGAALEIASQPGKER